MEQEYAGVIKRFLKPEERLVCSDEQSMPLVIEAKDAKSLSFLHQFLNNNASSILDNISEYGAVLLRGFDIASEHDFEHTVLSIKGMRGLSDAFMSEEGRIPVDGLKYVLHTNAVYKTGGTLYLGGFHSENYYSPDVPGYIAFCCLKPSDKGGETGLVNTTKIYEDLPDALKEKLKKRSFFVSKWSVSEVMERYQIEEKELLELCQKAHLPVVGEAPHQFILMYKPSIFKHPKTLKEALQINFFEVDGLNEALRVHFTKDYQGPAWRWHRFVWRFPRALFHVIELMYISCASFFYSPKQATHILLTKCRNWYSWRKNKIKPDDTRVGSCFTADEVELLAKKMRQFYSSCIWQAGDILLVDNRQVIHAGMPGTGARLVRAMISNPLAMSYSIPAAGFIDAAEHVGETLGSCVTNKIQNETTSSSPIPTVR